MRFDGHISTTKTKVREGMLSRHVARRYSAHAAYAISAAIGFPRLWQRANTAVLTAFAEAIQNQEGHDTADALTKAYRKCQHRLADSCNELIERHPPDASAVFIKISQGTLFTLSSCTGRVYVFRNGKAMRLTPREHAEEGLLRGSASRSETELEPNDLIIAGSATSFSKEGIQQVTSVLEKEPMTPPPVIATLLTDVPGRAGVGASAVVLRVN